MSGISQGMGQKNAEMGKVHFSVLKMGNVRRLLKVSFFCTPILGEGYKNVVFPAMGRSVYTLIAFVRTHPNLVFLWYKGRMFGSWGERGVFSNLKVQSI